MKYLFMLAGVAVLLAPMGSSAVGCDCCEYWDGNSQGYWKNHTDDWVCYEPDDVFSKVFGVGPDITLLEALKAKGGGENALLRMATAALLNAAYDDHYVYTQGQVKWFVWWAYWTEWWEYYKNILETW